VTTPVGHTTQAYVGAFVDELARVGIRHVCIAPGSRSTPLALLIAEHPRLRVWMHLDERSAAFFALGMARMLGEPVAILCTSGSAAANFLPAVVEARSAGVPLLVLTADRPPELREVGAAQTIDQNRLYGSHAKWFADVTLPDATPDALRYARMLACRAAAIARATPAGPVHLNFPFREPLVPVAGGAPVDLSSADALAWRGRPDGAPWVQVPANVVALDTSWVERLATQLRAARRPLIICGPQYDTALAAPLAALARTLGAPLLADPLSQVRWGAHDRSAVIDRYDAALRDDATAEALAPDLVLRFGAMPTSKPLLQFLQRHGAARLIVVSAGSWSDPTLLASEMIHADATPLCAQLLDAMSASDSHAVEDAWFGAWRQMDDRAGAALERYTHSVDESFEGGALAAIAAALPNGGTLVVSSSMPVRDLDAFAAGDDRSLRVLANRGANGIDGVVSSALGAAAAVRKREDGGGPLVLAIGDIAFYHDMNGLVAAKRHALDVTVVVINNDGGGIFSFLPQAEQATHFEELFGTPHGLEFAPVAELYGACYHRVETVAALRSALEASMTRGGLNIVELRTERERNVELHRAAWAAVAGALRGE
jgi:2-succinyl-5-enolpyruvyl-6-hydroxy-3-cyclohexene-1-carboxylate synthase